MKKTRITKTKFYELGGFSNPNLFRKADRRGAWKYYMRRD